MINFIKGKIYSIGTDYIIIENNNMGFKVGMSSKHINMININEEKQIFTHMNVREDDTSLFGFLTFEELNMFKLLISVSGIGPKVALGMLDRFTPDKIMIGIVGDDFNLLSEAKGVGKKTAQRIILDLKDKIKGNKVEESGTLDFLDNSQDAIDALIALGYSKKDSEHVIEKVVKKDMSIEDIIKLALKEFL
ncbi:MAG: Holliday junction branch migration protein RuvA [Lachnospirales bacterium]